MKAVSIVAFLSCALFPAPLTLSYRSQTISRQIRNRCRWSSSIYPWSFTTLISPAISPFANSFGAGFSATIRQMMSPRVATRGKPLKNRFSEKGTDPIAERSESHSPWKVYPSWQYGILVQNHGIQNVKLIYMVRHAEGTHNVNGDYKSIENLDARLTPLGKNQCRELRDELLLLKKEVVETQKNVTGNTCIKGNLINGSDRHRKGLEHLINGFGKPRSGDDEDNDDSDICVVVSPLTRCIQTALFSFDFLSPGPTAGKHNHNRNSNSSSIRTPYFSLEALRETVNYQCDRRRRISEVANEFPQVDFSFCQNDEDEIWMSYQKREKEQTEYTVSNNTEDVVGTRAPTKKIYLESAELNVVADRGRQALDFLQSLPQSKIVVCTHSAYLRCILNWGQTGGVPKMFEQRLDGRDDPTRQDKVFDFCYNDDDDADDDDDNDNDDDDDDDISKKQKSELDRALFEEYMRKDYENAELRSFCLLVQ